ncbi:hypothetical protein TrLO_g9854 [Triparma laevis f. longispina]|uniref:Uncharacterized protein n=1 Tax=Triparma laevis f. longispina TaxID=1714387 RepID=A0A9W7KXY2_9STRA|nr:hypothetical protein TrLO_g9854 [Triparma laevis f. longispina]
MKTTSLLLVTSCLVSSASGFGLAPTPFVRQATTFSPATTALHMGDDEVERGVSVDQDGKSNVWAIEPKMEVESKSSGEKIKNGVIAVAGLGVLGAGAFAVLTNLPDPNQF